MQKVAILVAALLAFALVSIGATRTASAQAIVGANLHGGAATWSDDDIDDNEPEMGFGFGARVFGAYKLMPALAVGANFDYSWHTFGVDGCDDCSYTASMPSIGLLLRSDLAPMFTLDVIVNYVFGNVALEADGGGLSFETDIDMGGVTIGLDALYRIQIHPYKTFIEVGPYANYSNLWASDDDENGDSNTNAIQFGLAVQGTFEIGL